MKRGECLDALAVAVEEGREVPSADDAARLASILDEYLRRREGGREGGRGVAERPLRHGGGGMLRVLLGDRAGRSIVWHGPPPLPAGGAGALLLGSAGTLPPD
ncbi:hypothetical protein Naga_102340g1 [Nannochloropsis gaditana]|uniref:Uncharacterized protein n=1 Tax=Nannochloropsis gaditana TaxID=72520 RepID=W7TID4_9STRA|nr:hypothetical protein Naga_102340g1 [Nannochloropsis gaditana]